MISNEMVADINVLCSCMLNRIIGDCWYLLTQKEYEGFRKRTEYYCSILPGVVQVLLFKFYHKETME